MVSFSRLRLSLLGVVRKPYNDLFYEDQTMGVIDMKPEILDTTGVAINKTPPKSWLRKNLMIIVSHGLTWLVSGISIWIAICANINTKEGNRIARESLEISTKATQIANDAFEAARSQFLQINRPYIALSVQKFNNGQYRKVSQEGKIVRVTFRVQMRNLGSVAANDIKLPDRFSIKTNIKSPDGTPPKYYRAGKVTLGPGDGIEISPMLEITHENEEEARKVYEDLASSESPDSVLGFSVDYKNAVDETQKYRTLIRCRIHNETCEIIKSESINLFDEIKDE